MKYFLGTLLKPYNSNEGVEIATDTILFAAATLDLDLGVKVGCLHHDAFIWQRKHTNAAQREYCLGLDVGMGLYVPGVNKSVANGALLDSGTAIISSDAMISGHCFAS